MARATGHLQVVERADDRRYYALWRDADGRHKRLLGRAWVKAHGKTARGATKWRAAYGPKPDDGWLTPAEAEERLRELLSASPRTATPRPGAGVTFGEACAEWLRYVEFDRQRSISTMR